MTEEYLKSEPRRNYARLILLEGEVFAVASSTLELYHKANWKDVPNGKAFLVGAKDLEELDLKPLPPASHGLRGEKL
jgi:glutamine amidotransferase